MEIAFAVASVMISVLGGIAAVYYARREVLVGHLGLRDLQMERVRNWAERCVDLQVGLIRECRDSSPEDGFSERWSEQRTRLSSEIEKGRWFFPTDPIDDASHYKDPAYAAYRHDVLDSLVDSYRASDKITWSERGGVRDQLIDAQHSFVTLVQRYLGPLLVVSEVRDGESAGKRGSVRR